ncbi:MAG: hypothetical protein ABL989_08185 [Gammaproteobacteria bacterium]
MILVKHSIAALVTIAMLTAGALVVTSLPATAAAAADTEMTVPTTPAEHAAAAAQYEQEALDLDAKAAKHKKTAAAYQARMTGMSGKQANSQHGFYKHCESLAKAYKAAAVEARDMAKMHQEMAQAT